MPPDFLEKLAPEAIVPLVAYLSHESTEENGKVYEAGAGWYGEIRWERTKGVVFKTDQSFTPAAVSAFRQLSDLLCSLLPRSRADFLYSLVMTGQGTMGRDQRFQQS